VTNISELLDFLPEEASASEDVEGNQKPTRIAA
jgi:hypothetical protein